VSNAGRGGGQSVAVRYRATGSPVLFKAELGRNTSPRQSIDDPKISVAEVHRLVQRRRLPLGVGPLTCSSGSDWSPAYRERFLAIALRLAATTALAADQ